MIPLGAMRLIAYFKDRNPFGTCEMCAHFIPDMYHCCSRPKPRGWKRRAGQCCCGKQKGSACVVRLTDPHSPAINSGWSGSGSCEMFYDKRQYQVRLVLEDRQKPVQEGKR